MNENSQLTFCMPTMPDDPIAGLDRIAQDEFVLQWFQFQQYLAKVRNLLATSVHVRTGQQ